jgi:hypothetical protein
LGVGNIRAFSGSPFPGDLTVSQQGGGGGGGGGGDRLSEPYSVHLTYFKSNYVSLPQALERDEQQHAR